MCNRFASLFSDLNPTHLILLILERTMTPEVTEKIENLIKKNKVFVFMKGTKLMPMCGFSNNVVQILNSLGVPFETCDVLEDYEIRQGIKEYSSWPTIPQVYINGELVGGSDVMIELYQKGELQQLLEVALAS
uniref:Monothiol glutaredoxin ycf64- like n=2 Tax=Planktothrix pseudagardhii TaxID=132604 RepID=A0A9W4CQD1_9CYAN|nr:putative monothiol glutaredoxin ycf64- like [Planktothrix pseudagardhii]